MLFIGYAQLMGFAGKRLQHKQAQTGLQALAAETGNGKIILVSRQLHVPRRERAIPPFTQPCFFAGLCVPSAK